MVAPGINHIRTGLSDCNHLPFQHWVLHTRPGTSRVHRHHKSCWLQSGAQHDSQSHGTESCKAPSPATKTLLASDLLPCPYQAQIALRLHIQPSLLLKKDILDLSAPAQPVSAWAQADNGACHKAASGTGPRMPESRVNRPNPAGPSTGRYYALPVLTDGREKVTLT